jgi:outer membrane lipoprotein
MKSLQSPLLILQTLLLIGTVGCAYPISYRLRATAKQDLTYPLVAKDPGSYAGETVIWGGVIILTRSQPNQSILTIQETPLDFWGVPKGDVYSRGRFIARVSRYLDEKIYDRGKKVTLGGEIVGEKKKPMDDIHVRYPVVQVQEIHLFGESHYYPAENSEFNNRGYRHRYEEPSPFHGIH